MFLSLDFNFIIWFSIGAILSYSLFSIFLIPLYFIRYYAKQGALPEYFPIIGGFGKRTRETPSTGDWMHKYREIIQKEQPNVKAIATNMGSKPLLVLVDPELVKEFLSKQKKNYVKEEKFISLNKYLIGNGLLTAEGKSWKKHRKIVCKAFHFEFIKEMIPTIVQTTQEMLGQLAKKDLKNVNIMREFEAITGEIVGRIFFGQRFSKYSFNGDPLTVALDKIGDKLAEEDFGIWNNLFGPRFIKAGILPKHRELMKELKEMRDLFRRIVEDAKKEEIKHEQKNLLDILLVHEKSPEKGIGIEGIMEEFLTFFIAGTDTTGHLLGLTVFNLLQDTQAYQKTLNESLSVLQKESELTYEDADKMNYTLSVLKETLRLAPPTLSLFLRRAIKDHYLHHFKIKRDTLVTLILNLNSLKEEYFDNPNAFLPERWMPENLTNAKWKKEPFSYIPFSAGPRNCIGQHLALLEARIILGMFLKRFDAEFPKDYKMRFTMRSFYEPVDPINLNLEVRTLST